MKETDLFAKKSPLQTQMGKYIRKGQLFTILPQFPLYQNESL